MEINLSRSNDWIQLSISDNGMGVETEMVPKVFDMFFRGNTRSKGTGMGLFITKGIIEQLGGTIRIESEINLGTTFFISLPATS